ncbi:MAG: ABC transporter permease [Gemmatimonadales bacterium]
MDTLLKDLVYALRTLRRNPGFTAVTVLTLALGIGANTAVFSVLYSVMLKPLPYPEPERLVRLTQRGDGYEGEQSLTYSTFQYISAHPAGLEASAVTASVGFNIVAPGGAVRAAGMRVSRDYLRTLGISPAMGRDFVTEEDQPGGANAVILSHGFWQRAFGGDPRVLGRSVSLDGAPYQVVGIMPADFHVTPAVEAWSTIAQVANTIGNGANLQFVGRLAPDVTLAEARARWLPTALELPRAFPGNFDPVNRIELASALGVTMQAVSGPMKLLAGAIAFVLLIACANVTSLVLGRGLVRNRELALRQALGASRARLIRQLFTESILLGLIGGALGLLLATWGVHLLVSVLPGDLPRGEDVRIDGAALGFTLGLSLLVGIVVGLLPAWHARVGLRGGARIEGSSRSTSGSSHTRMRNALVIGELALALVLLTGAGLLIRTFANLVATDPGFEPKQVLAAEIWLTGTRYATPAATSDFYDRLTTELAGVPGVVRAGVVEAGLPLERGGNLAVVLDGARLKGTIDYRSITPGYFDVLGVSLRQGRGVAVTDVAGGEPVVVVNESFAAHFLGGGGAALNRQVSVSHDQLALRRVVGVVADVRSFVGLPAPPTVFLPSAQTPTELTRLLSTWYPIHVVLQTRNDPARLQEALRSTIHRVDPQVPVGRVRPLSEVLAETLSLQRFIMVVLAAFASLAMLLAVVGIYGLLSYLVLQRTREIGVRLALGARPVDVLRMVLRQGLVLTMGGVVLGLLGAAALTRLLASQLHGVGSLDPRTFILGGSLLVVVGLVASALPAVRAARVQPMQSLRSE